MSQRTSPHFWTILGIGVTVVAGLGLLLVFLGRGPGETAPTITPPTPIPADDPVAVSVNGSPIRTSFWMEAVLLDQVMSGMAGQPAPAPKETLQRLINEELVLQAIPAEQTPTAEQVEAQIAALEQTWGADDAAVVAAMEKVGLTRVTFERAVARLLAVQAGMEALQSQGYDTTAWLEEQRGSAEIEILNLDEELKGMTVPYIPIAQSQIATPFTSPLPVPATETPVPSSIPTPATETTAPTPDLAIPEVAPDFTLERAGGGTLALTEQLAEGPVVLVFFRRGG